MGLTPGDKAPEFKLFTSDKREVSLSDYKGKTVVLHFFPAAFTGTCTKQLCRLRDDYSFYEGLNCIVLGCSTDTLFVLAKYKEAQNINFDLLSDYPKEACAAYGAQYGKWLYNISGNAKRSAFIIDGDGIIRYAEVLENANELPDFERMKQ